MAHPYSDNVWAILSCPHCGQGVERSKGGAVCPDCRAEYPYASSGALDLRLKESKTCSLGFVLETPQMPQAPFEFKPLPINPSPRVDFSSIRVPYHLTKELVSHFPRARGKDSLMLDLGCGKTIHREVGEWAGFEYVGLDYNSPHAPILGDAHALPFKDNSFEFVLSIAVLEHVRFPFVVSREVFRVIRPQGRFIGTVAFLEPFHGNSFYHHSHVGTLNSLQYGGFRVEHVSPVTAWPVLVAQARMALFPRMPKRLARSLVFPLQVLHRLWWRAGRLLDPRSIELNRLLYTAGAFAFIATKE